MFSDSVTPFTICELSSEHDVLLNCLTTLNLNSFTCFISKYFHFFRLKVDYMLLSCVMWFIWKFYDYHLCSSSCYNLYYIKNLRCSRNPNSLHVEDRRSFLKIDVRSCSYMSFGKLPTWAFTLYFEYVLASWNGRYSFKRMVRWHQTFEKTLQSNLNTWIASCFWSPEPVFRKKEQIGPGNKISLISFFGQL